METSGDETYSGHGLERDLGSLIRIQTLGRPILCSFGWWLWSRQGMRELFENIILIFDYLALELFWYVLDAIEFIADEIISFYYDFGYLLRDLVRFLLSRIV
ncbi:hypothetical protein PanWU01x14_340790 [Parasponia andersonii]|uniref:Uncharacterized protein n=1 Tax=Parasponia andersonii TaxID=3476 RepID=A0A2P5AED5_PARAD|nr:hypothetical protein PanWU01x14_340790 [Parasponia andersonii]